MKYTTDNTSGYNQVAIDVLNAEFENRASGINDESELDAIAESVLRDFDDGKIG